ncbi:MAG: PmoA family protein [Planctomycetaceae bacterium]|nr:PmoA family protein [Planctomycetaceae bacterium]
MNRIVPRLLAGLCVIVQLNDATVEARSRGTLLIEVQAGDTDRQEMPLSVTLPDDLSTAKYIWMQRVDTGTLVAAQRSVDDPAQCYWFLRDVLPAGQARRYRISASDIQHNLDKHVDVADNSKALNVNVRGRPVLTYHTSVVMPPEGLDPIFQRSGFIHPLRTPSGHVLTEAFPEDHLHQHGIFAAWVKTTFEGREIDFWNQKGGTGTVEHLEVVSSASGPVFGEFTVKLRHLALSESSEPTAVLDETWTVRVYDRSDVYVIDLISEQNCATDKPLSLHEYHYGGMAFRGTSQWLDQDGSDFLTSEGKSRADGNHSRPHWTDAFGLVDGQLCGVTVLQHPSNIRYPSPVRLHPSKPYFVYTPVALGEMMIEPNQPLVSQYRYIVHDGPVDHQHTSNASLNYTAPPMVKIID